MTAQVKIEEDNYYTSLMIKQSENSSWIGLQINAEIAELIIEVLTNHYRQRIENNDDY